MSEQHPVALFNGPIITADGVFRVSSITAAAARSLVKMHGFVSAVGHEAAAAILSQALEESIEMNRVQFFQQPGQLAIALKLNQRPPEGVVLDVAEMKKIGYSLKLMERLE